MIQLRVQNLGEKKRAGKFLILPRRRKV